MTFTSYIALILVLICIDSAKSQIATYDIHLGDLYKMQKGLGWPDSLNVVIGHEALLKLTSSFDNQQNCKVTTPDGEEFDIRSPPNNRFEMWGDHCGVRVKNVVKSDNGRWRLTAVRGNDSITGWTEVHVQENIDHYDSPQITLQDGQTHTRVELSTLTNAYCLVAQPFSESSLVPGHCSVTLDRTTRAVQGNWHVLLGLPGKVSELQLDRNVAVESERLDVGFLHSSSPNKLHLYCNIEHSAKNVTFCRFQKTSDRAGFNVMDGLSDGTHSYYGEGFAKRQCGMTIEYPTTSDYATWRCTVGVQEWVGATIVQKTPLQALIRVVNTRTGTQKVNSVLRADTEPERQMFVQRDMSFTISCQADASLTYCWFQHPNGSQYTPVEKTDDDQQFWYTGESLSTGDCGITFNHVSEEESGLWTCHMGPRGQVGIEITDKVNVRVTGPLAAREKEIVATIGRNATLYCHTSNGNRPLDYCRFLAPNSVGINIDSTVTQENAILGRFFFTPGRDLNYGDCSLTINPVLPEDVGDWTCAGLVDEETLEARDTIHLYTQAPRLQAGVIGMGVGFSALVVVLTGVLAYKYKGKICRQTNNIQRTDAMSLQTRSDHSGRTSLSSSNGSTTGQP